jgi:hypothetical protein
MRRFRQRFKKIYRRLLRSVRKIRPDHNDDIFDNPYVIL